MSHGNAARAAASLLVLALLAGACGKKGPLYLPDASSLAPAPGALAAALLPAECAPR